MWAEVARLKGAINMCKYKLRAVSLTKEPGFPDFTKPDVLHASADFKRKK